MKERLLRPIKPWERVLAAFLLAGYVIAAALFLLQMKSIGFSLPELGIFYAFTVLAGFGLGNLVFSDKHVPLTLLLTDIILILMIAVYILCCTVLTTWIQNFFVLI